VSSNAQISTALIDIDARTALFERQRPRLLQLAYGLLGARADAEDVVQDAYLRLGRVDPESLRNPDNWLTTVVTHLALDRLRSAQRRREIYVGSWLPEPFVEFRSPEQEQITRSDISIAILFLLEQLRPRERAVFLLREVFDVSYGAIAEIIGKSEQTCRQIFSRARSRIGAFSKHTAEEFHARAELVDRYADAILSGDAQKLIALMTDDAVFYSDGGGKVAANINPIYGVQRITRFIQGLGAKHVGRHSSVAVLVNSEPGLLTLLDGKPDTVLAFGFEDNRIACLFGIRNPDKLKYLPGIRNATDGALL
jgi:RNA polymerase sigma-70 factor (ECF subfamily)